MNDEIFASDVIKKNTLAYAQYILRNTFPCLIDGMKTVKRRILYSQTTSKEWTSGMQLVGNTLRIHPYGDTATYDAACRLTDQFRCSFPLLELDGKGNSYGGDKAASSRYVKFRLTDFCLDILFNGINFNTIPMELTEDLSGREIRYFIPKIPTALLYSNESVGFGYSSRTVPLMFENVCDLAIDFVSCHDKNSWNYQRLAKLFVPFFSIHVYMRNQDELVKAYSEGRFECPIVTEGKYDILANNSVMLRTLSIGTSTKSVLKNLIDNLRNKNHWMAKQEVVLDMLAKSPDYIDYKLTIKRGGNIFEFIDAIKGFTHIRSPLYVINNYVLNEQMVPANPPMLIYAWYKERYRSIFSSKKHRQQELQFQRMKYETYLIICEHVDEVITIIRLPDASTADIHKALKARFTLSTRQCEILLDSNINILMHSKRNELEEKLTKIVKELEAINESFKHIDSEMVAEIKALKKRYKTNTHCTSMETKYIGCVLVGDQGVMHIEHVDELKEISKIFNNSVLQFVPFNDGIKTIRFNKNTTIFDGPKTVPYTLHTTGINVNYRGKTHLFTRSNGKSRCVPNTTMIEANKDIFNYVSSSPLMITTAGAIEEASKDLFDNRKFSSDILYAFDPLKNVSEYILISVNAAHANMIRLQRFTLTDKLLFSGAGETAILAVVPSSCPEVIVNMPAFHKTNIGYMVDLGKHVSKTKLFDLNIRSITRF